jgi:hypothetical protein
MAKKSKGFTVKADFTKADEGGGRVRVPEGDYKVKVVSVKRAESQAGNTMLVWTLKFLDGKAKGKEIIERTVITPEAMWKVRQLLQAMGVNVPKKVVTLNPTKYIGREFGVTVADDEYKNRISSKVQDYIDLETYESLEDEDVEDEEDEDDEDTDDDDETEEDDEDLEEVDLDEEL